MILPHAVESIKTHKVKEKYNDENHAGNRNGRSSELLTNHRASHGQEKKSSSPLTYLYYLKYSLRHVSWTVDVDEDKSGRSAEGEKVINKTVQKCQRPGYDRRTIHSSVSAAQQIWLYSTQAAEHFLVYLPRACYNQANLSNFIYHNATSYSAYGPSLTFKHDCLVLL